VTHNASPVKSLEDILMEKRAKRFGLNPEKTTKLLTVAKTETLDGSVTNNASTGKPCTSLSTHVVDKPPSPASQTLPLLSRKVIDASSRMASGFPVSTSVDVPSELERKVSTTLEPVSSNKRIKMDEPLGLMTSPSMHSTEKISSSIYSLDDFEELEKDLDFTVAAFPIVYDDDDDLDKQLAEMENMLT